MDANGNLSIPERRALRKGDLVVYQTEGTAHRGEQRGRVNYVGGSGIVWIGTTGSRYALACDYVRRADWAPGAQQPAEATPEPARRARAPKPTQGTPKAPDAPAGQEMASGDVVDPETGMVYAPGVAVEAMQARIASLTAELDQARRELRCLAVLARDMIRRVKEVCGE